MDDESIGFKERLIPSPFGPACQVESSGLSWSFQKETNWGFVVSKRRQGHLGRLEKMITGFGFLDRVCWPGPSDGWRGGDREHSDGPIDVFRSFHPLNATELGDAVPQPPWDLSLYACSSKEG